jgi:hypothetical protein
MDHTTEVVLRQRFCRAQGCGAIFWICRHCDRGQSSTAAIAVVPKRAVSGVELQTSAISRPLKEGLIIETINEPIGNVWLKVA